MDTGGAPGVPPVVPPVVAIMAQKSPSPRRQAQQLRLKEARLLLREAQLRQYEARLLQHEARSLRQHEARFPIASGSQPKHPPQSESRPLSHEAFCSVRGGGAQDSTLAGGAPRPLPGSAIQVK